MSTNTISDFISDGYTEEHTIKAVEGVHGELNFSFRPAMAEQSSELVDCNGNDKLYITKAVNMLPTLLLGWTLKDSGGALVTITRENIARVRRPLLSKIVQHVFFGVQSPENSLKN